MVMFVAESLIVFLGLVTFPGTFYDCPLSFVYEDIVLLDQMDQLGSLRIEGLFEMLSGSTESDLSVPESLIDLLLHLEVLRCSNSILLVLNF